jgi:hypothetical protein
VPLEHFLFDTKAGYCQHFSGAMALLLRFGGIPARVATGFSPGGFRKSQGEWIVRDRDAHSWVEAWFDGIGWVTFDPDADRDAGALADRGDRGSEQRSQRDAAAPRPPASPAPATRPGARRDLDPPECRTAARGSTSTAGRARGCTWPARCSCSR